MPRLGKLYQEWVEMWDVTPIENKDTWTKRFKIAIEDALDE